MNREKAILIVMSCALLASNVVPGAFFINTFMTYKDQENYFFKEFLDSPVHPTTSVDFYPTTPGARSDGMLQAIINGKAVQMEYHEVKKDGIPQSFKVNFIRLAVDGPVHVALLSKYILHEYDLRALWQDIATSQDMHVINFTLPGPGDYYMQVGDFSNEDMPGGAPYTVAFLLDDLDAMTAASTGMNGTGTVNVVNAGIQPNTGEDLTTQFQDILDGGNKVIYIPAGRYLTGTLEFQSNTTLFLEQGSLLEAVQDESRIHDRVFLLLENVTNVTIHGAGTIDAGGWNIHNVNVFDSSSCNVNDVFLRRSMSWALHFMNSTNCTTSGVCIFGGRDGIDPDSSQYISVDHAFIMTLDDPLAVKAREGPCFNISISNCTVASIKSALKIGTETRYLMENITYRKCEVFCGERGIVMYAYNGGPIRSVEWLDIRLNMTAWDSEDRSGYVLDLEIDYDEPEGIEPTPVDSCVIDNVSANWIHQSFFRGVPDAILDGFTINNVEVHVCEPKDSLSRKPYLFHVDEAQPWVNLTISNVTIHWNGNQAHWAGISSSSAIITT